MAVKEKVAGRTKYFDVAQMAVPLCPGCQNGVIGTIIAEAVEELGIAEKMVLVTGAGCSALIQAAFDFDQIMGPHGRGPDLATGLKRVNPDSIVLSIQGDGDLLAIGADSLVGALTRGENITIIMINNTNYSSTGGQMSPASLLGQVTPTSPSGRGPGAGYPVHGAELISQFRGVAYSARGAVNSPANFRTTKKYVKAAFEKQMKGAGLSYVEILAACPVQWHLTPVQAVKRVEDQVLPEYPLGEFKNVEKAG